MDWRAEWIWHPPTGNPDNFYLHARREFDLPHLPEKPHLLITASSLYKLYVNGHYVGRGPNPADPSRYYYDTYAVGKHLQRGRNVVAALCYNYGPEAHGVLGQNWGPGGLLLELRADGADGEVLLKTDGTWRVLQSPAWRQDAPLNCTLYGDFKEIYDSRREPDGWNEVGYEDADWREPLVLGRPPVEPWTELVPREIPFLGGERVRAVNAFWESASVTYSWRDDWEAYDAASLLASSPGAREGHAARVLKTHADFNPSLILDFGRDVTGYLQIKVQDSAGGVVDVLYGEDLYLTRVDTFLLEGGPQVLRPFNRRTFRYCKLLFRETPDWVHIEDVSLKMDTYPVEHRGAFACSDELLNRIWEVGRYTMRMSMLDHFVDCPWRERTLYGGDMWAENLIAHYAFGDPRMTRKCLRQMAHIQHELGALPPYGPYRGADGFYPSWSAFWALTLLDHYELAGDRELLEELWPNLEALLEWALREMDNPVGLLRRPRKSRKAGKRPGNPDPVREWTEARKGAPTPWDNLPFYALLRRAASLAAHVGRDEHGERWAQAAGRMREAIGREFLDGETGLCRARRPREGQPFGEYNTGMALWCGAMEEQAALSAAEDLFGPSTVPVGAPFGALFILDGLFRYGRSARALDFTRTYWGEMLARGATTFWDNFSLEWPPGAVPDRNTSLCHGWAAGPTYALPAYVLGVRPLEPGFARMLVEPRPGGLTWAEGRVPTPRGEVALRWSRSPDRFSIQLTVPADCRAEVALPAPPGPKAVVRMNGRPVEATRRGERYVVQTDAGEHELTCRPVVT